MRAAFYLIGLTTFAFAESRNEILRLSWEAEALYDQARFEAASAAYARVIPLLDAEFGQSHPRSLIAINNHAAALLLLNRGTEAETILRDALDRRAHARLPDDESAATTYGNLEAFTLQGKFAASIQMHERALSIRRGLHPTDLSVAESLHNLGESLRRSGELTRAAQHLHAAIRLWKPASSAPFMSGYAKSLNSLGLLLSTQGQTAQAEHAFLEATQAAEAAHGTVHEIPASIHYNLAAHYRTTNNWPSADRHCRTALNVYELLPAHHDPKLAIMLEIHAEILSHLSGRAQEAKGQRARARAIFALQ